MVDLLPPDDEAPHYLCATVADMARIPADALPRFLAELPAMLAIIRPIVELNDALGAPSGIERLQWVDDDHGSAAISLKAFENGKVVGQSDILIGLDALAREQQA